MAADYFCIQCCGVCAWSPPRSAQQQGAEQRPSMAAALPASARGCAVLTTPPPPGLEGTSISDDSISRRRAFCCSTKPETLRMLVEAVKRVVEEADAGNLSEICPSLSEGCGDDRRKRLSTSGIVENRHTAVSLLTATARECML